MEVPQTIKNKITRWFSNSTFDHMSKRIEIRILKRNLLSHIHSSIIHNSQYIEATQMSTDKWMDKEYVMYTYNGISALK